MVYYNIMVTFPSEKISVSREGPPEAGRRDGRRGRSPEATNSQHTIWLPN